MRSAVALLNGIKAALAVGVVVCALAGAAFGDYCSASGEDYFYEYIWKVEVWTINNATAGSNYSDYTELSTELYIDYGYLITVTNGDAYSGDQCGVWVDWNGDEDFEDANESILMSGGPETFTGTITPPEGSAEGATRMRVRIMHTGVLSPCGTTDYGEVEDYTLIVTEYVSPGFGGGSGTAAEPYLIYTAEQMNMIGVGILDWDKHFRLMADIDMSGYTGESYNIIGSHAIAFSGVFDGGGHTISNFTYDSNWGGRVGLFGQIDDVNAEVRDLGMIEPDINVGHGVYFGPIAGVVLNGSITNCYVEGGSISGECSVGGLVGYGNNNRISDCHSTSKVRGGKYWVGGLVGSSSNGNITNCYSTGHVAGGKQVGGLIGTAGYNSIEGCYSTSDVTVGSSFLGGLVGDSWYDSIVNCHSSGDVGGGHLVGGLVGYTSHSHISGCYSSSTVTGNLDVGGLVGANNAGSTIFDCYSTGSVTGYEYGAGGLAGYSQYSSIFNCYSTSSVDGNDRVGGLVGTNFLEGSIVDCYSTGRVTGRQQVGGLVGKNENVVSGCFSRGDVVGETRVGGFLGWGSGGVISDCYALGDACGVTEVGGLVGLSEDSAETYHCYCAGSVDGNDFVGGFAGYADNGDDYTACFWDSDVNPGLSGIGNRSDPGVTGETTANMQTRGTFTDAGWDFIDEAINGPNDIWEICEGTNYAKFVWQIPEADFVCPDGVNFIDYSFFAGHWLETDYGDVNGVELTGDGRVNWEDFGVFAGWWLVSGCGDCGGADLTGEGDVDYADLGVFTGYWLESEYGDCGGAELTGDGAVGADDLREFSDNWLVGKKR